MKSKLILSIRLIALNIGGLIVMNILICQNLFSQQISGQSQDLNIKNYSEELYVRTDRDIYITGEQIWFKVYKLNGLTHSPSDISKVVYVELLDKNNFPLKQLKVKADYNSGSSVLLLPNNISSGNYTIRAYTNWMQNQPVDLFCYKTISVINPFESIDHLLLPQGIGIRDPFTSSDLSNPINSQADGNQVAINTIENRNDRKIKFKISQSKPDYSSREKAIVEISATDEAGNPVETNFSVSIAKSVVVNSIAIRSFSSLRTKEVANIKDSTPSYLPELEGHLISGHIRLKVTNEPLCNTDLSLAFVGKTARCQFSKTNSEGEFYFVIKEPGLNEIVIQPLSPEITGYYIELNQPFSSIFKKLTPDPFYLDSNKIQAINNVIIGMQINNIYEPFRQNSNEISKTVVPDFYGKPENTIKMADYIELTSLREVVKEIIPNVYTLKQNGKYDFKLINKFRGQPFENKPLVLVDGVPIYDFEKVLSINSKDIERADVINTRYFYSENVFDGIVSFITKKGNLSAMEFDNTIFRQVYEGCQVKHDFYSPDYGTVAMKDNRIPDFRNTLYWNPDLKTGKDGKTVIEFYTSDESCEYTIIVEGISPDGKTGFSSGLLIAK
jgi:hypothetical protein